MSVRLKRLYADSIRIAEIFSGNPYISVLSAIGTPPEKYEIEFRIKGLEQKGSEVVPKDRHLVEIVLPYHYPREAPKCRMLTPIFHPNIAPHTVCIGDHWSAGESLAELIVRIGEMICFQSYNIKSPLNGEAAKWVEENISGLPTDTVDLTLKKHLQDILVDKKDVENFKAPQIQKKEEKIEITVPTAPAAPPAVTEPAAVTEPTKVESARCCSNCKAEGADVQFFKCDEGHVVCTDCIFQCQTCGKTICLVCAFGRCSVCETIICETCQVTCPSCHKVICKDHVVRCAQCQAELCPECISDKTKNLCKKCAPDGGTVLITQESSAETPAVVGDYCKNCGHKIEFKSTLYCTACGYKFR